MAGSSHIGFSKRALEVFKFSCYLGIPVTMMLVFANNQNNLEAIVRNRSYVVYPPEGPRPPTAEEMKDLVTRRNELEKNAK